MPLNAIKSASSQPTESLCHCARPESEPPPGHTKWDDLPLEIFLPIVEMVDALPDKLNMLLVNRNTQWRMEQSPSGSWQQAKLHAVLRGPRNGMLDRLRQVESSLPFYRKPVLLPLNPPQNLINFMDAWSTPESNDVSVAFSSTSKRSQAVLPATFQIISCEEMISMMRAARGITLGAAAAELNVSQSFMARISSVNRPRSQRKSYFFSRFFLNAWQQFQESRGNKNSFLETSWNSTDEGRWGKWFAKPIHFWDWAMLDEVNTYSTWIPTGPDLMW